MGPFNVEAEDGGIKIELIKSSDAEELQTLQTCTPKNRKVETDMSFSIQREQSGSDSSVKFLMYVCWTFPYNYTV